MRAFGEVVQHVRSESEPRTGAQPYEGEEHLALVHRNVVIHLHDDHHAVDLIEELDADHEGDEEHLQQGRGGDEVEGGEKEGGDETGEQQQDYGVDAVVIFVGVLEVDHYCPG